MESHKENVGVKKTKYDFVIEKTETMISGPRRNV